MTQAEKLAALEKENARLRRTLREREVFIRRTFGRYLTDEILDEILSERGRLHIGGERRIVSMLLCDLRSSTALSEAMDAAAFIDMLNHFFAEMIEIINAWQGNILEFVGDEIVAVFGAPRASEESARDAAGCAVAMQRRMPAVNAWNRAHGYPQISMGIGLHTGEAILGNIGSETRTKYDMIGRNVNLAARVQGCTAGGQILATEEFLQAAGDQTVISEKGAIRARLKGIQTEVSLYELVGFGTQRIPAAPETA